MYELNKEFSFFLNKGQYYYSRTTHCSIYQLCEQTLKAAQQYQEISFQRSRDILDGHTSNELTFSKVNFWLSVVRKAINQFIYLILSVSFVFFLNVEFHKFQSSSSPWN